MATTDETKAGGKSGGRKAKVERKKKPNVGKSPAPVALQNPEPVQPQNADQNLQSHPEPQPAVVENPVVDQPLVAEPAEAVVPVEAVAPMEEVGTVEAVAASPEFAPEATPSPAEPSAATAPSPEPAAAAPPAAEPGPVSLQTIANAYREYTRKSIEEFGSFVEQLSGARSIDKAMTVQSEFVKRAYETSVAESQKICELHARLAKQTLDPFKGLGGKAPETHGKR
jgi:phasin family protein